MSGGVADSLPHSPVTLRSPSGAGAIETATTPGSSAPLDGAAARRWPSQRFHHRRKASRPGTDRHSAAAGGGSRRQAPPLAGLLSRADRSAGHTGPEAARATRSRFPARSHSGRIASRDAWSRRDSVGLKPCRCCRVAHTDTHRRYLRRRWPDETQPGPPPFITGSRGIRRGLSTEARAAEFALTPSAGTSAGAS